MSTTPAPSPAKRSNLIRCLFGLAGVAVLFVVAAGVIGGRSRALGRELANAGEGAVPARLAQITREHLGGVASWTNTGLALGIVFVMTTKPSLVGSLAALVVAASLGAAVALRLRQIGRHRV